MGEIWSRVVGTWVGQRGKRKRKERDGKKVCVYLAEYAPEMNE
jgi:hypothetical protein